MRLNFKKLHSDAQVPVYGTRQAAGADLFANTKATAEDDTVERIEIAPGQRMLIKTGLGIELPAGLEAQVRPRSGLALKHGITVLNSPGTIDADFRGDIGILLLNTSNEPFTVKHCERIAQLVIASYVQVGFRETDTLRGTERGENGFGSTGMTSRGAA